MLIKLSQYLTAIVLLLLSSNIIAQNDTYSRSRWEGRILSDTNLQEVKQSLHLHFTKYFDKKRIPSELYAILNRWDKDNSMKWVLANPNQPYNSTDLIISDNLPCRQLISIYINKSFAFILYEHGGIAYHRHIIWCKLDKQHIIDLWACSYNGNINTISELQSFIGSFDRQVTVKGKKYTIPLCF
jgi:hypothetical protein